jgi:hypothetical protein
VTPGDGQAFVSWQPNFAIWGYIPDDYIAKTNRGSTCIGYPPNPFGFGTSCTLTGLTNGLHYSVHVYATYDQGSGDRERKGPPSVRVKFTPGP